MPQERLGHNQGVFDALGVIDRHLQQQLAVADVDRRAGGLGMSLDLGDQELDTAAGD